MSALLLNAAIERSSLKTKERFDAVARGWDLGQRAKLLFAKELKQAVFRELNTMLVSYLTGTKAHAPAS